MAGDQLYYYVASDGRVVITNTPSRNDVQRIKSEPKQVRRRTVALPASRFDPHIRQVAAETGVPARLIKAVAIVESSLDPRAVSHKGAQGLMQLMPQTARQYGVTDPFDPLQNLRAGSTHLGRLLERYDGDLTLALAAYNAGAGAVRRHGGVPNYPETKDYVRKVHERLGEVPSVPRRPVQSRSVAVQMVRQADGSLLLAN